MPRLYFFVAARYFRSINSKIAKTYWNSEVMCLVDMSFLKEVSQKNFVFELQNFIFEGSLAQKGFVFELQSFIFEGSLAQKGFVFDLQSFIFEGSLAQKLLF